MSKQDRQGVRTPVDIERKYSLGQVAVNKGNIANVTANFKKLDEKFVEKVFKTGSVTEYKTLSDNDLTDNLKANYDKAYTHSQSAHAPVDAQANVIEAVKVNGSNLNIDNKTVNVPVPTKVSAFENDKGYLTAEKDPTVPAWAKAASKPSYTASEVGAATNTHKHDDLYQPKGSYASEVHKHSAGDINSGTLNKDRLPTILIDKGGTGANDAATARSNLGLKNAATKDVKTASSVSALGWTNQTDGDANVPTISKIAFWNGAYSGTSSNLAYCNKGAFGEMATKNYSENLSNQNSSYVQLGNVLIQYGTITVDMQLNTTVNATVNFPKAFSKVPVVSLTVNTGAANSKFATVQSRTTSSFALSHTCTAYAGNTSVSWIAIGSA